VSYYPRHHGSILHFLRCTGFSDPGTIWPIRQIVFWTSAHIFHVAPSVGAGGSGGDNTFGWVLAFCRLVFAVLATAVWSLLNQEAKSYVKLHQWFRVFIRICLAAQMLGYGLGKVIPIQMPYPDLTTLLPPFGNFSLMGILWSSVGVSPAYEIFAGCAEMLGGLLLIFPRTATFGALISLADMIQVFMLNMTYDVGVKLASFHLLLLAVFLLAPDLRRLIDFFFLNRVAEPSPQTQLFGTRSANRTALAAQILFGFWLMGMDGHFAREVWYSDGGGRTKPSLYGIWEVSQMWIDEQLRPPLLTDSDRWRRVIFDFPTMMTVQRMDDSFISYRALTNGDHKMVALSRDGDKKWSANFAFERAARDQLSLDGAMNSHKIHMELQLMDRNRFRVGGPAFHWIHE
jgi:hypothetical protein